MRDSKPDRAFTRALPKVELHAHLTGSISRKSLHEIWLDRRVKIAMTQDVSGGSDELEDPLIAIPSSTHSSAEPGREEEVSEPGKINVATFFPLFDRYIYNLVDNLEAIRFATMAVLMDFADDGVVYIELRTTPRAIVQKEKGGGSKVVVTKEEYVRAVLETMRDFVAETEGRQMMAHLILSIDRRNTLEEAMEVVELANKFRGEAELTPTPFSTYTFPQIIGLDLCGNPLRTPITHLAPAFTSSSSLSSSLTAPLPLALHFAETPTSSSSHELSALLSWNPKRLGHCIHVPVPLAEAIIAGKYNHQGMGKIGIELCLSCNVQAGMMSSTLLHPASTSTSTTATATAAVSTNKDDNEYRDSGSHHNTKGNGYSSHHFAYWYSHLKTTTSSSSSSKNFAIALSTDDVGIFESKLSNEYFLASYHFNLSRQELVDLSRGAVDVMFGSQAEKQRVWGLLDEFEKRDIYWT